MNFIKNFFKLFCNFMKAVLKSIPVFFCYLLLFLFLIIFTMDKFLWNKNLVSVEEVGFMTLILLVVIFFMKYSPVIKKMKFKWLEIEKDVKEKVDRLLLFSIEKSRIISVGTNLKKQPFQDDGDELRKLEEIYAIPKLYKDKLSKEEMDELRQLWNKYILRELASTCLAFFDKKDFGVKEIERDIIKKSTDVYFPSPDRVLALSKKAGFEQKMKQQGKERVIEQFNVFFDHFQSSYQEDKNKKWLKWDLPKIVNKMQINKDK